MTTLNDQLWDAVRRGSVDDIRYAIASGAEVNVRYEDGGSVLFEACMMGNLEMTQALLELGADPNFLADEPVRWTYAHCPLDLVMQARHLTSWEKYNPICEVLQEYGATILPFPSD